MTQLAIDKWAEGRPRLLAVFAHHIAAFADDLHEILSFAKKQEHIAPLPEWSRNDWLPLYRNHRLLQKCLLSFPEAIDNDFTTLAHAIFSRQTPPLPINSPGQPDPALVKLAEEWVEQLYQASLAHLAAEFGLEGGHGPAIAERAKKLCRQPEYLFLFKVEVPCWVLYRTAPSKLLRKARLGDLDALEKLIRLDKHVLADSGVNRQTIRLLHHNKYKYEAVVAKAVKDAPKFKLSRKNAIYILAGFLSVFSEALGHRLVETEIRDLFNAIAQDRRIDKYEADPDLQKSVLAFGKAIQRERALLMPIFFPDKTL